MKVICGSSLFYKRGYSQNPPPVPLQEAHRPAILKLRHRPTSVQDVPTCEPLARTDHEPKAHLCLPTSNFCLRFFTVYRHTWRMNFPPQNEIWTRISPCIFSSQAGIQRSFLDVQSLTGLYTDIRSGRIVYSKTRYVPRTANLFFRAKRGIGGCFVGENSVSNCI